MQTNKQEYHSYTAPNHTDVKSTNTNPLSEVITLTCRQLLHQHFNITSLVTIQRRGVKCNNPKIRSYANFSKGHSSGLQIFATEFEGHS